MNDKEKKKIFRRKIAWFFLKVFTAISGSLSLEGIYFLGGILGNIAACLPLNHCKIAYDSLSVAFPRLSTRKRKDILRNCFIFMVQSAFELLHFLKNPDDLENVRIEGEEYLKSALVQNRGVIILTAHLGNFPLLGLKLANAGYPVNFVTRPMRDEKTGDYLYNLRTKAGVKSIFSYPRRECVNGIIKALRDNEIVVIQMDQNFGTGGVWVKFFGHLAATPVGAVVFALRTKAVVLPGYIYRQARGKHCIKFLPAEELIVTEDKDQTVLLNVMKFTRIIEIWVRDVPSQWGWIHRRWKSRPSDTIKNQKFRVEE